MVPQVSLRSVSGMAVLLSHLFIFPSLEALFASGLHIFLLMVALLVVYLGMTLAAKTLKVSPQERPVTHLGHRCRFFNGMDVVDYGGSTKVAFLDTLCLTVGEALLA